MDAKDNMIKWPGPWLDEELTKEESDDVLRIAEILTAAKESGIRPGYDSDGAMTKEWGETMVKLTPFLNSFMHLVYKLAKDSKLPEWVMQDPVGATTSIIEFMLTDESPDQVPGQITLPELQAESPEPIVAIIRKAETAFSTIRQGTATNALTKIRPTKRNTTIDTITGAATIKQGEMTVTFPSFETVNGLKTSTYKLLDAITEIFTASNSSSPIVQISLDDYMERCALKDRKEARKQAIADLETLRVAAITFKEKRRGKEAGSYYKMNISGGAGMSRNGIMTFSFSADFFGIMRNYPPMAYPKLLYRLNSKRNPNSYYLLRKIAEHKNMNIGKKNEDIISVKTLLAAAPFIPSYNTVTKSDRHYDTRIIAPFERDMDALGEAIQWEYCHKNNEPLTDDEASTIDYPTFSTLNVHVTWAEYPDQSARLEKKTARIKTAQAKKAKKPAEKGGNAPRKRG